MSIRIAAQHWPTCTYRVRYAESREGIFRSLGWRQYQHHLWAIDVGPVVGRVRVGGKVYRRDSYSVGVYAPGTVYEENMEVGRIVSWAWMLVDEKGKPSALKHLTGETGFCLLTDPTQEVRKKIGNFVEAEKKPSLSRSFRLNALLNEILGILFALHSKDSKVEPEHKTKDHGTHPWRQAAQTLLEQSPSETLTAKRLSSALGISASTLTHQYRQRCGESLQDTIHHWRLEKACVLLGRQDLSIKEVAAMVGLSHQSYLSAFFKKATSYRPSDYRKLSPH